MVTRWETVPNLPPNLVAFGNSIQKTFPKRDQASDGAWGDAAHKLSPSGHNLDDTPGSLSETSDPDNIPELRAIDVDSDLNGTATLQQVLDSVITSPDRDRLYYVIYRGRIAGTWTDWKWTPYSGSSGHYEHGHISGDPDSDANGKPFASIEKFGETMPSWDDKIGGDIGNANRTFRDGAKDWTRVWEWLINPYGKAPFPPMEDSTLRNLEKIRFIHKNLEKVEADITTLTAKVDAIEADLKEILTLLKERP